MEMEFVLWEVWRRERRRSGQRLLAFVVLPRPSVMLSPIMEREVEVEERRPWIVERRYQWFVGVVSGRSWRSGWETWLPGERKVVVRLPGWPVMEWPVWPVER